MATRQRSEPSPGEAPNATALLADQLAAFGAQYRWVVAHSQHYQTWPAMPEAQGGHGLEALVGLPVTRKDDIIAAQTVEPPYGGLLCCDEADIVRHYAYPTGQVVAWSQRDQATMESMYADGLRTMGLLRTDRVNLTFQYQWVAAGTVWDAACRHLGAAVSPGGAGDSARHAINMRRLRTNTLIGFGSFLERIAEAAEAEGIDAAVDLAVEKIVIVGEMHGSDQAERLAKTFGGADVREAYGTSEAGLVACECAVGQGMHAHKDVLVEVLDQDGRHVPDGGKGELVLTPLTADAMPVLRFATGDITDFHTREICPCGSSAPRIGRIIGRASDLLRVKGMFVSSALVRTSIRDGGLGNAVSQLVATRNELQDELRLFIEAPPDSRGESVAQAIISRLKELAGVTVEVVFVDEGRIDPSRGWYRDGRETD